MKLNRRISFLPWWARLLGAAGALLTSAVLTALPPTTPTVWQPVSAEELAAAPTGDAVEAGAEVLLSQRDLELFPYQTRETNYRRVKIHEERAVEALGKLEVLTQPGQRIEKLAARVTHRDGTSADIPRISIEESTRAQTGVWKWKTQRLVVPGLAAGDVVDVQWVVVSSFGGSRFFFCQEELPVRKFEFQVGSFDMGMNLAWFRAPTARLEHTGIRRDKLTITDLPAFQQEPDAPAYLERRATVLLMYGQLPKDLDKLWGDRAGGYWNYQNSSTSPNAGVKQRARELAAGAGSDEEKLRRFYRFCQEDIVNASYDESPESVAHRTKDTERSPGAVLGGRRGTWAEIDCLFAALCRAAGFEVRLAGAADRDEIADIHFSHGSFFLRQTLVAVKAGEGWRFFSPGCRPLPFGLVRWENENTDVLLADPRRANFASIPRAGPEKTMRLRRGTLVLAEDGQLEGDIEEKLTGHLAVVWRANHWSETPAELERTIRDRVTGALPGAEVENIRIEALLASESPLVLRYHLRVPAFGQEAGNRRIFQPGVFYQQAKPRFTAPTRVSDVAFDFAWQERDEFEWRLPAGFELESPQAPAPVQAGDGVIRHNILIAYDPAARRLGYTADFSLGQGGATLFSAKSYAGIKMVFERIQAGRSHMLVLRPTAAQPGTADGPAGGRP